MGSGKTTLGTVLSEELNCRFIDLDDFIEAKHNSTIRNLFERFGEERFRQMEHDALLEVAFDTVGTKKLMLKTAGVHITKL